MAEYNGNVDIQRHESTEETNKISQTDSVTCVTVVHGNSNATDDDDATLSLHSQKTHHLPSEKLNPVLSNATTVTNNNVNSSITGSADFVTVTTMTTTATATIMGNAAKEDEPIIVPVNQLPIEEAYISNKYNELVFNKRQYDFIALTEKSETPSVQELRKIVFEDWRVIERKPFGYTKAEPVEFYRPTSGHMNMTLNENGEWVIPAVSTSSETATSVEAAAAVAAAATSLHMSNNNEEVFKDSFDSGSSGSYTEETMMSSSLHGFRTLQANDMEPIPRLSITESEPTTDSLQSPVFEKPFHEKSTATTRFRSGSAINSQKNSPATEIPSTRRSFFNKLIARTDKKKGESGKTSSTARVSIVTEEAPFSPSTRSSNASPGTQVYARITGGSISEQFEKKQINDSEISGIQPLTKDSYLGKTMALKDTTRIMSVYDPNFEFNGGKERISCRRKRQVTDPYPDRKQLFLFQFEQMKFDCGAWEPLFCRVYLYDAINNRKASEDYAFHINSKQELDMLDEKIRTHLESVDQRNIYKKPTALFQLTSPNPEIYVIIWIERVLQGRVEEVDKVYEKEGRGKDKILKRNREAIKKLSYFRQPFIFGAFNIFMADAEDSKKVHILDGIRTVKFRKISHVNAKEPFDISKYIPETQSNSNDVLSWATMKVEIKSVDRDSLNDLFVIYQQSKQKGETKMHPLLLKRSQRPTRFALEANLCTFFNTVEEFPLTVPLYPALEFKNTLYMQLDTADLSFAPSKYKTFVVEFYVKMSDKSESKVQCIGDPFDPERLTSSALSSVVKHERMPQFFTEFRIEVPTENPGPSCHIFMEIFAVRTDSFTGKPHEYGSAQLKSMGYSFISLYNNNHAFIKDGYHVLPIYSKLEDGYLTDETKCTKIKNAFLNVRTKHASTMFMQDDNAAACLHSLNQLYAITAPENPVDRHSIAYFDKMTELLNTANNNIPRIIDTNFLEAVQYSHVILRLICALISRIRVIYPTQEHFDNYSSDDELMFLHNSKNLVQRLKKTIFDALLYFLHGMNAVEGRRGRENKTLSAFIDSFFENIEGEPVSFYNVLFDEWLNFIRECDSSKFQQYKHKFDLMFQSHSERIRRKSWSKFAVDANLYRPSTKESTLMVRNRVTEIAPTVTTKEDPLLTIIDSMNFSWFFFEMVIKSMLLEQQQKKDNSEQLELFKPKVIELIKKICPVMITCSEVRKTNGVVNEVARRCNYELALFIRDLFQFTKKEYVNDIMNAYFKEMEVTDNDDNSKVYAKVSFKLDFTELLSEYDAYVDQFILYPEDQYSFVQEMVTNIIQGIRHIQGDLRLKAVHVLKRHLTKLDFDTVLNSNRLLKKRVFTPYFKFVELFLKDTSILQNVPNMQSIVDILCCFYSFMLYIDDQQVMDWLKNNDEKYLQAFYDVLLLTAIVIRKYDNSKVRVNLVYIFPQIFQKFLVNGFLHTYAKEFKQYTEQLNASIKKQLDSSSNITEEEVIHTLANDLDATSENFEKMDRLVKLFDRCSYFCVNLMLLKPQFDAGTFLELISTYVYPFLSEYSCFYVVSRIVRLKKSLATDVIETEGKKSNEQTKYEINDAWQMMVASVLLNTALPVDLSVPIILQCLQILLSVYAHSDETSVGDDDTEDTKSESIASTAQPEPENDKSAGSNGNKRRSVVAEGFINYTTERESHMIRAATFKRLVERLFQNNPGYTPPFNDCFFLTYFSVASSHQVLREIKAMIYEIRSGPDISAKLLRVVNALKTWVNQYFENMDCSFLASLVSFIAEDLTKIIRDEVDSLTYHRPLLQSLLRKMIDVEAEKMQLISTSNEESKIPARFDVKMLYDPTRTNFDIMEWDSTEIAKQITLIDTKYFVKIQHTELIAKKNTFDAVDEKVRKATAPNVSMMTDQFNKLALWVQTCILEKQTVDDRVKIIKKLFEVCEKLYDFGNFHSCCAIRSGFRQAGIIRLVKTWQKIPHIELKITKQYGELFKHPYENLLNEYDMRTPPMIPLMAQFLSEIALSREVPKFISEKIGPNGEKLINYERMRLLARAIRRLKIKQQTTYNFVPVPFLIYHLTNMKIMDADTAFDTSLKLEPRQA